jgi:hypothetical protein
MTEVRASVLETDRNLLRYYIEYYIFDLIPLLKICDEDSLNEEDKNIIYEKSKKYFHLYRNK